MVAYSFDPIFSRQVSSLKKLQTVRRYRDRHAMPGEPLQLYARSAIDRLRLLDPDPICLRRREISIMTSPMLDDVIASIAIDGRSLHRDEIEAFASADGFSPEHVGDWRLGCGDGRPGSARWNMGAFWSRQYGVGVFSGVLIEWRPA